MIISQEATINELSEQAASLMKKAAKETDTEKTNRLLALALDKLQQAIRIADRGNEQ